MSDRPNVLRTATARFYKSHPVVQGPPLIYCTRMWGCGECGMLEADEEGQACCFSKPAEYWHSAGVIEAELCPFCLNWFGEDLVSSGQHNAACPKRQKAADLAGKEERQVQML